MEILFIILKIIGVLLAVLILLCAVLILVPIRYRVDIKAQDTIEGRAAVHWLLHFLDIRILYRDRDISFRIRIFGIALPLDRGKKGKVNGEQSDREDVGKKAESAEQEEPGETAAQTKQPEEIQTNQLEVKEEAGAQAKQPESEEEIEIQTNQLEVKEEAGAQTKQPEEIQTNQLGVKEEAGAQTKQPDSEKETFSPKKKRRKSRKNPGVFRKIKSSFYNLKKKAGEMAQSIRQRAEDLRNGTTTVKEQIRNIKSMILEETNQKAFLCVLLEARYLLRHYLPGRMTGTLHFSMGSPDQTGKALGAMSLLPFWARSKMVLMPDFVSEAFYIKGILYVTGHVRILHVLKSGFRLIRDKNVRKLIANIRSLQEVK